MSTSSGFSGLSSYSSDLAQVINRSLAIAALPMSQMQNQVQTLTAQQSAMNFLDSRFASLQSAMTGIENAVGPSSYSGSSSIPTAVTAVVNSGALEGTYSIDVIGVGSYSSSISSAALPLVTDPNTTSISTATTFTLTVNSTSMDITPTGNSLADLAQAINASAAGVQASIVNTGDSGSPQYRLMLRSNNLAADTISLAAQLSGGGTAELVESLSTGAAAEYKVNGIAASIHSSSRSVTLAPGVTINLLQTTSSGQPAIVTVARSANGLSNALNNFVNAYNDAVDALNDQVGPSAGALAGQSTILQLRGFLRQITQFTAESGAVSQLHQIGIDLDSAGKISFNAANFNAAKFTDLQAFLGTATEGGFLKAAADALNSAEDPEVGSIKAAIESLGNGIARQNERISHEQDRLSAMQLALNRQMSIADSALAALESKRNYMTNLFTAMMNQANGGTGVKSSF